MERVRGDGPNRRTPRTQPRSSTGPRSDRSVTIGRLISRPLLGFPECAVLNNFEVKNCSLATSTLAVESLLVSLRRSAEPEAGGAGGFTQRRSLRRPLRKPKAKVCCWQNLCHIDCQPQPSLPLCTAFVLFRNILTLCLLIIIGLFVLEPFGEPACCVRCRAASFSRPSA